MNTAFLGMLILCGGPPDPSKPPDPPRPDKEFNGTVTEKGPTWFEVKGTSGKVWHLTAGATLLTKPDAPEGLNFVSFRQIKPGQQLRVSVFIDKLAGAKDTYRCEHVILWGVKLGKETLPPHGKPIPDE